MPDEALRIVLDTNVLLVSVASRSKHHWIFQSLLAGDYELFVNTEILITADPDDNKFVDCAVAANAHALVSHDRHLKILEGIEFPRLRVMAAATFRELLDRHLKANA